MVAVKINDGVQLQYDAPGNVDLEPVIQHLKNREITMKQIALLLLIAGTFMISACSSNEPVSEVDQDSTKPTEAAATAPVVATDKKVSKEMPAKNTTAEKSESAPQTDKSTTPPAVEPASASADITFICTKDNHVRTIRVLYLSEGPSVCEVTYEKSSGTKTLWNADNDKTYCEDKALDFVTRQEGWGWGCKKQ